MVILLQIHMELLLRLLLFLLIRTCMVLLLRSQIPTPTVPLRLLRIHPLLTPMVPLLLLIQTPTVLLQLLILLRIHSVPLFLMQILLELRRKHHRHMALRLHRLLLTHGELRLHPLRRIPCWVPWFQLVHRLVKHQIPMELRHRLNKHHRHRIPLPSLRGLLLLHRLRRQLHHQQLLQPINNHLNLVPWFLLHQRLLLPHRHQQPTPMIRSFVTWDLHQQLRLLFHRIRMACYLVMVWV
mmetsp:Transcript_30852/g.45726  ORF Transcript_30852/g.45726 Transcript_30852/m.45726 type:complete len:239 (+) Transcript_30852:622-1338(+)